MSDPIKAALNAAGEAARETLHRHGCGEMCALPPCPCAKRSAAAAIEAFLEALPWITMDKTAPALAAAVRRVAGSRE